MAVPGPGNPINMRGIFSEKNEDDYTAQNMDGETDLSLRGLSSNSFSDTGSGGNIPLNTGFASTAEGGANLTASPFSISEFRGYNHTASTAVHETVFQPQKGIALVGSFPNTTTNHYSGVSTTLENGSAPNLGSFTTQGTFSVGGKTGVNLAALYNFNEGGGSTNGSKILLQFHHASGTNFTDSGWSTAKIYANNSGSGSPLITLNRTSANSFASQILSGTSVTASYTFNGTRAFSSFFGTNTTASNNTTHFLKIE